MQCGPLLQRIRTIHSDADELARNGYCVLRAHFPPSLIDACRTALWPTLLAHIERHEPNRGAHRHYFAMPFDPPCFAPDFFFDEAILRIVRGAYGRSGRRRPVGVRRSCRGVGVSGRSRRLRETVVHEWPELVAAAAYARRQLRAFTDCASRRANRDRAWDSPDAARRGVARCKERDYATSTSVELDVGDVLIRHPWALHRGSPNMTSTPRALVSIRYVRRWYADDSRDVNRIPRAVWNTLTDAQRRIMRFPVAGA